MLRRDRPLDRHLVDRRLGLVPRVGDDGDAAAEDAAAGQRGIRDRELHGRTDPGHPADGLEVVPLDVAAVHRTRLHRGPLHTWKTHVDPVDSLAGDLGRHIEVLLLGAHQRPLVRRLDGDRFGVGVRCLRGPLRDLAVGRRPAAPRVGDDAVLRRQLGCRHVPHRRRGEQQPLARFRAGELQVVTAVLHRRGCVGAHPPVEAVGNPGDAGAIAIAEGRYATACGILGAVARDLQCPFGRLLPCIAVRGRVLRTDLAPVALQLLAHHHGVGGPDALAELGLADADRHGVVGSDDDPRVDLACRGLLVPRCRRGLRAGCARLRTCFRRQPEAEHEGTLSGGDRGQKLTAIDVRCRRLLSRPGRVEAVMVFTPSSVVPRGESPGGCGDTCCSGRCS